MLTALYSGKKSARWQVITEVNVVVSSNFPNPQVYLDVIKGYWPQNVINTAINPFWLTHVKYKETESTVAPQGGQQ